MNVQCFDVAPRLRLLSGRVRAAHVLYNSRADTQLLALQMRVVMLHIVFSK
jgi:hypothetical protein